MAPLARSVRPTRSEPLLQAGPPGLKTAQAPGALDLNYAQGQGIGLKPLPSPGNHDGDYARVLGLLRKNAPKSCGLKLKEPFSPARSTTVRTKLLYQSTS